MNNEHLWCKFSVQYYNQKMYILNATNVFDSGYLILIDLNK